MRLFKLDPRLGAIAELIPAGSVLYDVGTDHARLPVHLTYSGVLAEAYASDVAEKPLIVARMTAERFRVADKVHISLCDGVPERAKDDPAACIVIAGMGGETISAILSRAEWLERTHVPVILQPMTKREVLCGYLDGRYVIDEERSAADGGRNYTILRVYGAKCGKEENGK